MSPLNYLLIAQAAGCLMAGAVLLIAWQSFRRPPHVLLWACALLLAGVNWTFNLLPRSALGGQSAYWIIVNGVSILLITLAFAGFALRVHALPSIRLLIATGLASWLLIVFFTLIQPHVGLQMAVQPAYTAVMLALSVVMLRRAHHRLSLAENSMAVLLSVFAICLILASAAALMQGATGDAIWRERYYQINFLPLIALTAGTGMFAVLVIAADLSRQLQVQATTDQLTGLLNRRGFFEQARSALALARRQQLPVSLMLMDLDHFKRINDDHGHQAGDEVLQQVARLLNAELRTSDLASRWGGEEFLALLVGSSPESAVKIGERVRKAVAGLILEGTEPGKHLTISVGVTDIDAEGDDLDSGTRRADDALYNAKGHGRDRVSLLLRGQNVPTPASVAEDPMS